MKKNSTKWLAAEAELKMQSNTLLLRSRKLKSIAEDNLNQIMGFFLKYPEDKFNALEWEEKEIATQTADKLFKTLDSTHKLLAELDEDAHKLSKEMNEFYGYTVWEPSPKLPDTFLSEEPPKEDYEKPTDWWNHNE